MQNASTDLPQASDEFPVIVWLDGSLSNPHWLLDRAEMVLGREESCDIVIPVRQISRQHLRIITEGGSAVVEDLRSKNGTWVNGYRLTGMRELEDGDEIRIAKDIRLRFVGSGATAPSTTRVLPDVIPSSAMSGLRMMLDPETHEVRIKDEIIDPPLSLPQYRLLEILFASQGGVCSRNNVVDAVWPDTLGEGVSEQAIDALVRRLRDRLSQVDSEHQYIVTVRGHGFRLDNPQDESAE
ncbi:MAG: FHA domain-containing protein [Chloroflexota bacterium]|nr:FHA domain-containing protein [Chloroflexota bacterium]MDE2910797.1 FHA domain-containing protein [Chloroflexota bacterium]